MACNGSAMVVKLPRPGSAPRMIAQLNRPLLSQTQASVRIYQRSGVSQPIAAIADRSFPSGGWTATPPTSSMAPSRL